MTAALEAVAVCTWEGQAGWGRTIRALPDGCPDIVWDGRALAVVGAHAAPLRYALDDDSRNVGLRLRAGTAGTIIGWPASELPDVPLAFAVLWGGAARRLETALAHASDTAAQRRLLEGVVADRLDLRGQTDWSVVEAARRLAKPSVAVERVADAVGLGQRELRRRFRQQVGYGPKTLQRVLRFQAFLRRLAEVAAGSISLALVAAELGYADQAHLGRECRRLSGSSPRKLVRTWSAYAETF